MQPTDLKHIDKLILLKYKLIIVKHGDENPNGNGNGWKKLERNEITRNVYSAIRIA